MSRSFAFTLVRFSTVEADRLWKWRFTVKAVSVVERLCPRERVPAGMRRWNFATVTPAVLRAKAFCERWPTSATTLGRDCSVCRLWVRRASTICCAS
jgi:hypothetical protein